MKNVPKPVVRIYLRATAGRARWHPEGWIPTMHLTTHAQAPTAATSTTSPLPARPFAVSPSAAAPSAAHRGWAHDLGAISVSAPIQRVISLHGEDEDRDANVARLNRLLGNSGGRVRRDGANVVWDAHPDSDAGRNHASYRLLRRMIEHQHDVKIGIHPEKGAADPVMTPYHAANASTAGTGSRSFIHMPRVAAATPTTVWDQQAQQFTTQDSPDHLQLGHELIHADHAQRGTLTPYDQEVERRVQGELAGFGAFDSTHREKREEAVTIGLVAGQDGDDITENRLRRSLGLLPRGSHDRIESHLLRDHARHFNRTKDERAALHQEVSGHAQAAEQSRGLAEAAHGRMQDALRREAEHRQTAADNLPFVQGLRGGGPIPGIEGATWDMLADAHQENVDRANERAAAAALEAAQHRDERDLHTEAFRGHRERHGKSVEAFQAKDAEMRGHHAKATQLKERLGLA